MRSKTDSGATNGRRGYSDNGDQGSRDTVRYGTADAELLRECIDAVTNAGDCIQLSRTTDGGAFVVRVLSDAGNGCWYPPNSDALEYTLRHASDIARGL